MMFFTSTQHWFGLRVTATHKIAQQIFIFYMYLDVSPRIPLVFPQICWAIPIGSPMFHSLDEKTQRLYSCNRAPSYKRIDEVLLVLLSALVAYENTSNRIALENIMKKDLCMALFQNRLDSARPKNNYFPANQHGPIKTAIFSGFQSYSNNPKKNILN